MSEQQRQTGYDLLGRLSITFAAIEHGVTELLERLLGSECGLTRPYLLDELSLSRCTQKIREVAKLRLSEHKAEHKQLKNVLTEVDAVRRQRNLLIHGVWIEDAGDGASTFTVLSCRPRIDKKTGVWEYLESERVDKTALRRLLARVVEARKMLDELLTILRKTTLRGEEKIPNKRSHKHAANGTGTRSGNQQSK